MGLLYIYFFLIEQTNISYVKKGKFPKHLDLYLRYHVYAILCCQERGWENKFKKLKTTGYATIDVTTEYGTIQVIPQYRLCHNRLCDLFCPQFGQNSMDLKKTRVII